MNHVIINVTKAMRQAEQKRPKNICIMYQQWRDLLFLHWPMDPELIAKKIPCDLRIDTHNGMAWVGIVPFSMRNVRPRFLPAISAISNFEELNLRTYVIDRYGRPGVWFFSLDSSDKFATWIAKKFFHLPYANAKINRQKLNSVVDYTAQRLKRKKLDQRQSFKWETTEDLKTAEPGSLEFFLLERYRLFAQTPGDDTLYTGRVHHKPYQYAKVNLSAYSKRLFSLNKLPLPEGPPVSAIASPGADVSLFRYKKVNKKRRLRN
jgi:uncharacterized protein YqjF (DUF2071 family)